MRYINVDYFSGQELLAPVVWNSLRVPWFSKLRPSMRSSWLMFPCHVKEHPNSPQLILTYVHFTRKIIQITIKTFNSVCPSIQACITLFSVISPLQKNFSKDYWGKFHNFRKQNIERESIKVLPYFFIYRFLLSITTLSPLFERHHHTSICLQTAEGAFSNLNFKQRVGNKLRVKKLNIEFEVKTKQQCINCLQSGSCWETKILFT